MVSRAVCRAWVPLALLLVGALSPLAEEGRRREEGSTLVVVEGTVASIDTVKAEAGLEVVRLHLSTVEGTRRVLLAPAGVLEAIDFPVETEDLIRVRAFASAEEEDLPVHKVLNLTRARMVRLRTLHRDPIWDSAGVWQGGPGRHRGGAGPREGAGKGGRP